MTRIHFKATIADWFRRDIEQPLEHLAGGPARLKVIGLLACVLGLNSADMATVGAIAVPLKQALHIGNLQIGLLVTVSTAIGAVVTLPFGVLADRVNRSRVLAVAIMAWSLAMVLNGASGSYTMLLLTRLLLGVIVAAAGPLVISLTGDFFPAAERGRIFGYILAGELLGVAFGFLLSGNIVAVLSWRAAFWALALLGLVLAIVIWRLLPEPSRGGQSFVLQGAEEVPASSESGNEPGARAANSSPASVHHQAGPIERLVAASDIQPHIGQVLHEDPERQGLWQAVRYVLSVRTFRALVIASGLGYFYFTGLRTFALTYMRGTFGLGQAAASTLSVVVGTGAIAGVLLAGRIGDRLIRRGTLAARIDMGAASYLLAAGALFAGLFATSLYLAAPLFFLAALGLGGANPSVDAARLDVMHSSLWGRAEGVRSALRYALSAVAAPLFGYLATGSGHLKATATAAANAAQMRRAMLILLVTLVAAGLVMLVRCTRTYPRDVATTLASERKTRS